MPGVIEGGAEKAEVCSRIDIPYLAHNQVMFPYPGQVAGIGVVFVEGSPGPAAG